MSLIKYRALVTALHYKNLTKAAEQLGYTQPGISHMILSLEKEFGFPLLIRQKDGIEATENAKQLLPYLQEILESEDQLKEMINQINGIETGCVRIGAFFSVSIHWLPSIIQAFSEKYPNIELQLFEGDYGEITTWLKDGQIDCALMSAPVPDGFEFIPFLDDPILALLPQTHPLARHKIISPSELVQSPFIIPSSGSDEDIWRVLVPEGLTPNIKYRVKGDETIIAMVAKGLGVSLMPKLLLHHLPETLVTKPLTPHYFRTLGLTIRSKRQTAPATKKFIQICESVLKTL